ncbi:MAG: UvrD-helicase domain-containing protein [Lutibacter sp.]|uniref:UvrD-helicase domain-containing protein n=1 Tax=Lutibacter sp. TaxID=1925666 RepID=UPI00185CED33|nr:UvrD-helicase domain-containing protein [Lutibacter sp.]MBT8317924.1 UvrD-helicase domain-containing protein [Lutibacter sp.]NNJ58782.1 UvrD-helicase domain-containing protein [Lutibacter sp.]
MQKSTISFQVYNASAGSGKTFTLVKEYLKILLSSSNCYKFQQILAVTFTNKAAGEMKGRVIENLKLFSEEKSNDMLSLICVESNLTEETVFNRSKLILNAILQNYSAFSITTIDSFTHKLIRTFAYDLKLPMNFEVEMDAESLLNEAVDIVISKIGEDRELTDLLVSYSIQRLDDDKAWDISRELKDFAKVILNENNTSYLKELSNVSMLEFKLLKAKLQKENKEIETKLLEIGNIGLKIIKESGVQITEFANSGELPNHFVKLTKIKRLKVDDLKFEGRLNKVIEENKNLFAGKCTNSSKRIIESIATDLKDLYYKSKRVYIDTYKNYILNGLIIESLIPLAVLNFINSSLDDIKSENNILLNAEFNQKINDTIKNEPAPFIYERIGEKFRYYFIDEMQDTSELQWKNLIPLIDNVVTSENEYGERGKLLLVGDAKQSIYRWRGGKAEQFISLSSKENEQKNNPFYIEKNVANLETNYRSFSEIIDFNNSFFKHISKFLNNESFKKLFLEGNNQKSTSKQGGFVQLSFVEKEKDDEERALVYPKKVLDIIKNLDTAFQNNDVCVLVRTRKQGVAVAKYLSENGIEIISSETLLLSNSSKVNFIINLLNVLQNPLNKEFKIKVLYFLYEKLQIQELRHSFFIKFIDLDNLNFFEELKSLNIFFNYNEFIQCPFYESIEYVIRSFHLISESDSNIQFFLDVIFEFQQKKEVSLSTFLEFWELKKDKLSIVAPEAKNAVRIMTIHKAKGLEFPVVIYPYSTYIYNQINPKAWYNYNQTSTIKSILVNYGSKLKYTGTQGEQLYNVRRDELELDNFNVLYVALTRAVEQLYIVSEKNISKTNQENLSHTSGLFINYLKELNLWNDENTTYEFGDKTPNYVRLVDENTISNQQSFITNSWKNHNISIVASSSLLWDTEQGKSIIYGNLIHEILSKIVSKEDISTIVNQYIFEGTINELQKKEITTILLEVVNHHQLEQYFEKSIQVFTEQEIVTSDKHILIPDRLVLKENKITIIDYKTGKSDKKYHRQVENYARTLMNLGYVIEKKLLVYINNKILVEEI